MLPTLAEEAMRGAIIAAVGRDRRARPLEQTVTREALIRFERSVAAQVAGAVRAKTLYTARAHIAECMRRFLRSKLGQRSRTRTFRVTNAENVLRAA